METMPAMAVAVTMGLLPDTENCALRMHRGYRERFPCHRMLAIPTCITARAWRTCPDACRVSSEVGGGENVPGIPGACATCNFLYLVRGPYTGWLAALIEPSGSLGYHNCEIIDVLRTIFFWIWTMKATLTWRLVIQHRDIASVKSCFGFYLGIYE